MERETDVIVVQLKSDLCAASGDGFSSGIDIDICFGNNGLPLIPARRLKGCLREGATLLYPDGGNERDGRIDHLFGVAGGSEGGSLHIGDATIRELGGKPVEQLLGPDGRVGADTLRRLVGERAQTSMNDDGTAKKNSLRFVRIVHRTDPWAADGHQSLTLVADVSFDAKDRTLLADACRATRNIGLMRNRGFGAVRMELGSARAQGKRKAANAATLPRGTKRFSYRVRLDTPLMLPQRKGSEGLEYVPGTSVLGFFAGRMRGSKRFDELFLQGKVRFSALHPVGADNKRCTPAPTFVGRVKGGKHDGKYLLLGDVEKSADKAALKPLRGGFVDSNLHPVDMRTEIVYHHSRQGEGTLYTQHCLSAGQELAGVVESDDPKLLAALAAELSQADQDGGIRFGRSKTAQYSRCSLVSGPERDRALGALTGLALGDALGMPTQSMSPALITRHYGRIAGLRDAVGAQPIAPGAPAGSVTDDTEQALLIAELLIAGRGRIDPFRFADALLAWEDRMRARGSLDLLGPSTKLALERVRAGADPRTTGRAGTTNGAAMRVAPVGIAFPLTRPELLADAVHASCVVTHDTRQGFESAALIAVAVSAAVSGADADRAVDAALDLVAALAPRGHWSPGASVVVRARAALDAAALHAKLAEFEPTRHLAQTVWLPALLTAEQISRIKLEQWFAAKQSRAAAEQFAAAQTGAAEIAIPSGQSVHVVYALGYNAPEAPGKLGQAALPLMQYWQERFALPGLTLFANPLDPAAPLEAIRNGSHTRQRMALDVFAANAIRAVRLQSPRVGVAVAAQEGGQIVFSFSATDNSYGLVPQTFRWQLSPTDSVDTVVQNFLDLMAECQVEHIRLLRDILPENAAMPDYPQALELNGFNPLFSEAPQ